jgi:hypothetical protein
VSEITFSYIAGEEVEDVQDPSVAKQWSEVLLDGIRGDFARPTMHSRNLWHISAAMYDAWAIYDDVASTYLLGKTVSGFTCNLNDSMTTVDLQLDREEALSYAAYRLISYRYVDSPGAETTLGEADDLMASLGYDVTNESTDTSGNSPAALGNLIAQCYIDFGLQDGSNEVNDFANTSYSPVNPDIDPNIPGNPGIIDLDRWQPISLPLFIDQSGNPIYGESIFLSPEWGQVVPFSLTDADKTTYERDGFEYQVYHDPGAPPSAFGDSAADYQWGFALVSIWSSHLDPADGVMIDISPASFGNIQYYPTDVSEYPAFYDQLMGGDPGTGYTVNPVTGLPYEPQFVPRGDYARVLAEFWADGPASETPPGHWFTIVNTVSEHPDLVRQIAGEGDIVGPLEWDIKAYFVLGGAMHDSAITAWGIKGWYDYLRPVSAIRAMADFGQSSDPALPSYSEQGIPLTAGYVELVDVGDPLAGDAGEHVGKIKVYAWRGPDYIADPDLDIAGVGWILAENWWPYQRPTFVTPPFAGYVSGHSVFSRAAADVLTSYTGSPYFPGGMSDFQAPQNEFLVFEEGPSVDITLQWATYRDASDQTSLSRIWGGIHPPADDLPGRVMGAAIAEDAYSLATGYFNGTN